MFRHVRGAQVIHAAMYHIWGNLLVYRTAGCYHTVLSIKRHGRSEPIVRAKFTCCELFARYYSSLTPKVAPWSFQQHLQEYCFPFSPKKTTFVLRSSWTAVYFFQLILMWTNKWVVQLLCFFIKCVIRILNFSLTYSTSLPYMISFTCMSFKNFKIRSIKFSTMLSCAS